MLENPGKGPGSEDAKQNWELKLPACEPALETSITAELIRELPQLYADDSILPYHSWPHALEVREFALKFAERAESYGYSVDKEALEHAALLHDILSHLDPQILGYESREALSADYSYKLLMKLGAEEQHASKVARIIRATHPLAVPESVEDVIIRAADLKGLTEDYPEFRANTERLFEEHETLSGKDADFNNFARGSLEYLSLYVWRFLELTPEALNNRGVSAWHEKVAENVLEMFAEISGGRDLAFVSARIGVSKDEPLNRQSAKSDNSLLLGFSSNQFELQSALQAAQRLKKDGDASGTAMFFPCSDSALPLPDACCDEVVVTASSSIPEEELKRVLRPGGRLIVE